MATSATDVSSRSAENRTALLAILTINFTVLLHYLTVRLEHILKRHKHLSQMLQHMYRELMILGMISFGLFVLELSVLRLDVDERHLFETVHIMVFLVVIGYTVMTILLMCLSVALSRHWDQLEEYDHTDYMHIKEDFERIREELDRRSWLRRLFSSSLRLQYFRRVEQIAFHDLRLHFIHSNHLSPEFSFARYLRKCKQHVFLQLGDIHSSSWMMLLLALLLDMFIRNVFFDSASATYLWYFPAVLVFLAISLCVIAVTIYLKTRRILNEILCRSEMIDFDPIAARYYIEHWHDEDGDDRREHSVSYTLGEGEKHAKIHFAAESAAKQVARVFRVSQWGLTFGERASSPPAPDAAASDSSGGAASFALSTCSDEVAVSNLGSDIPLSPHPQRPRHRSQGVPPEPPHQHPQTRLARVQSVHVVQFAQLELFWFNSHVLMLRLIQLELFMLVFFYAVMIRFRVVVFSSGAPWYLIALVVWTPLIVIGFLALSIPIYTIIIHVGQLVDLDTVIEARRKGALLATHRPARGMSLSRSRRLSVPAGLPPASAASPVASPLRLNTAALPCGLARVSTMQMLSGSQRRQLITATIMCSRSMQTFISWMVLVHAALLVCTLEPSVANALGRWMVPLMFVAPGLFTLEIALKAWSIGVRYFSNCIVVAVDAFVVFCTVAFAVAHAITAESPAILGLVVLCRLLQVVRVAKTGRIMVHRRTEAIENDINHRNSLHEMNKFAQSELHQNEGVGVGDINSREPTANNFVATERRSSECEIMPTIKSLHSRSGEHYRDYDEPA